jgi:hypothetical protein
VRRGAAQGARAQGRAVQVDPIKPKLKPPGTKRLKLRIDMLLSTSAFKSNLRRYIKDALPGVGGGGGDRGTGMGGDAGGGRVSSGRTQYTR